MSGVIDTSSQARLTAVTAKSIRFISIFLVSCSRKFRSGNRCFSCLVRFDANRYDYAKGKLRIDIGRTRAGANSLLA